MNGYLHPHLPYDEAETVESYIRRVSQFHTGRDGESFLKDLGIDKRAFLLGSDDAISKLAEATGTPVAILQMGTFQHKVRYRQFRGENCSVSFLRPEGAMVCPECLKEDSTDGHLWTLKGRMAWRLRSLQSCSVHNCQLFEPENVNDQAIFMSLTGVRDMVSIHQAPTDLELNIANRLSNTSTGAGGWLDGQTIEQGAKACEMVGASFAYGHKFSQKGLSAEQWRDAGAVGYDIARNGPEAVSEALTRIAAMSSTTAGQAGPKAVYGSLYEWIAYGSKTVEFGPIRDLLRENILNTLAIEPDDVLLGERVTGRRLHSVYSLSVQAGLHRKRLRKILVQAGLASEDSWDLSAHRLVFDADKAELLCQDIIESVSLHLVPAVLGCSRTQAESLYRERIIVPVIAIDTEHKIGKLAFARRHLSKLLHDINLLPIARRENPDLVTLTSATKRTNLTTGNIMSLVLNGSLIACRVNEKATINEIRFHVDDLNPIKTRQP